MNTFIERWNEDPRWRKQITNKMWHHLHEQATPHIMQQWHDLGRDIATGKIKLQNQKRPPKQREALYGRRALRPDNTAAGRRYAQSQEFQSRQRELASQDYTRRCDRGHPFRFWDPDYYSQCQTCWSWMGGTGIQIAQCVDPGHRQVRCLNCCCIAFQRNKRAGYRSGEMPAQDNHIPRTRYPWTPVHQESSPPQRRTTASSASSSSNWNSGSWWSSNSWWS